MPRDLTHLFAKTRRVEHPELGVVLVREATMEDYLRAGADRWWFALNLQCEDGSAFVADASDLGRLRAELSDWLLSEVTKKRPTPPPNGGAGATETRPPE